MILGDSDVSFFYYKINNGEYKYGILWQSKLCQ